MGHGTQHHDDDRALDRRTVITMRSALVAAAIAAVVAGDGAAQDWQTYSSSRQFQGESEITTTVQFLAGTMRIRPGSPATLYRATMRYDASRFNVVNRWSSRGASDRPGEGVEAFLRVGLDAENLKGRLSSGGDSPQYLDVELSPSVPTDLRVRFGMARADIELGGLAISRASIETGASETAIHFSAPNLTACDRLEIAAGAAELKVTGLGNAACRRIDVKGGAGEIGLDFTGTWAADGSTDLHVAMGLGHVTLRVPQGVGLRVNLDRILVSFSHPGMVKRGSDWYSANYDSATTRLSVEIDAALGGVNVVWVP